MGQLQRRPDIFSRIRAKELQDGVCYHLHVIPATLRDAFMCPMRGIPECSLESLVLGLNDMSPLLIHELACQTEICYVKLVIHHSKV